ncbi:MAG: polyketide synthase dehydratase domain-containing protein [Pirellulales bacterium]|nr:polyketide synthase dehydratase domain-containing protein [Pirellulales bacterium]
MSDFSRRIASLSHERLALLAERLYRELDAQQTVAKEPLAIVGLACRFAGAGSTNEYWNLIRQGRCQIGPIPNDRWEFEPYYDPDPNAIGKSYSRHGAFLTGIDQFDAAFFNIGPQEAISMDPQQRFLLEVAWETLESAGIVADSPVANRTGVFLGIGGSTYGGVVASYKEIDVYSGAGNVPSIAAGRLSYCLGMRGPNLAVDTACSSSAVAFHLACRSLRYRECDAALVCGVNLILAPETYVYFCRVGALSRSGRCLAFDAQADGYVRGEGCAAIALKRLSDATAAGDRILALVRGSAMNHDGRTAGLLVPSPHAQQQVIRDALADADVAPRDVDYVETHGTGTPLGDPIEIHALSEVYSPERSPEHPLFIGSVKTLVGHTEAAAGLAGVIKTALALHNQCIPVHAGFANPSPRIDWEHAAIRVPLQPEAWPARNRPRLAAVSSFGLSGTNVHIVLEEAPTIQPAPSSTRLADLLCVSAKSQTALASGIRHLTEHGTQVPSDAIGNLCYSSTAGRAHFAYRACTVVDRSQGESSHLGNPWDQTPAGTQGSIKIAMWIDPNISTIGWSHFLNESEPTFRDTLAEVQEMWASLGIQSPYLPTDPLELLTDQQLAIAWFTESVAAISLWRNWGVAPNIVAGSGLGRLVSAWILGALPLEQAGKWLLAATSDSKTILPFSCMELNRPAIALFDRQSNAVIPPEQIAIHAYLEPIEKPGCAGSQKPGFSEEAGLLASSLEGRAVLEQRGYFVLTPNGSATEPVSWYSILNVLKHLYLHGCDIDWDAYHRPHHRRRLQMPSYPFERKSYWRDRPNLYQLFTQLPDHTSQNASTQPIHPLLGNVVSSAPEHIIFSSTLRDGASGWLSQQVLGPHGLILPDAMMETMAAAIVLGCGLPLDLSDIQFSIAAPAIRPAEGLQWQCSLTIQADADRLRIRVRVMSNGNPSVAYAQANAFTSLDPFDFRTPGDSKQTESGLEPEIGLPHHMPGTEFYRKLLQAGIFIPGDYRGLDQLDFRQGEAVALVRLPSKPARDTGQYVWHPAMLHTCRQVALAAILGPAFGNEPIDGLGVQWGGLEQFQADPKSPMACRVHARSRRPEAGDSFSLVGRHVVDLWIRHVSGRELGRIRGLELVIRSADRPIDTAFQQFVADLETDSTAHHVLFKASDFPDHVPAGTNSSRSNPLADRPAEPTSCSPKAKYMIRGPSDLGLAIGESLGALGARSITFFRTDGPCHIPLDCVQRFHHSGIHIHFMADTQETESDPATLPSIQVDIACLPEPAGPEDCPSGNFADKNVVLRFVLCEGLDQLKSAVHSFENSPAAHLFMFLDSTIDHRTRESIIAQMPGDLISRLLCRAFQEPGVRFYIPWSTWNRLGANMTWNSTLEKSIQPGNSDIRQLVAHSMAFLETLAQAAPEQRQSILIHHLRQQIRHALGMRWFDTVDPEKTLDQLGIDSLLAVELSAKIADLFGLDDLLIQQQGTGPPTLTSISEQILQALGLAPDSSALS